MFSPEELERRQKMRELYGKYKDHLPEDKNVIFRNTNEAFYNIREEKTREPLQTTRPVVKNTSFPRKNRFRKLKQPKEVRKAVRTWIFHTLRTEKKQPLNLLFFKDVVRFVLSTAVIFCVLLVIFNFEAYKNVVGYWWEANVAGGGETQKNFEHFTKKEEPIHMSADEVNNAIVKRAEAPAVKGLDIPVVPSDNRIIISKIGQNIPIKDVSALNLMEENWKALEDDLQHALKDGVVRYPGTAQPGQIGNVFITGHSSYYLWDPGRYKDVFALLHNVEVGDTITIFYNQDRFDYVVDEKKVVSPNDVDVLSQTNDKRLTLMTCTPIGTALNRLIIVAKQVEKK